MFPIIPGGTEADHRLDCGVCLGVVMVLLRLLMTGL